MKTCLHCGETFLNDMNPALIHIESTNLGYTSHYIMKKYIFSVRQDDIVVNYYAFGGKCFKCGKPNICIEQTQGSENFPINYEVENLLNRMSLFPFHNERAISKEVPLPISDDYKQATRISGISTKASATLARRCLQATFRDKFPEVRKKRTLFEEINWVIENGGLDDEINDVLHKLRDAGNFGAHPSEDGLTEIYDLSQEDLEACFLLLDHLFDIFYVLPAKRKEKLAKLKEIPSSKKT